MCADQRCPSDANIDEAALQEPLGGHVRADHGKVEGDTPPTLLMHVSGAHSQALSRTPVPVDAPCPATYHAGAIWIAVDAGAFGSR